MCVLARGGACVLTRCSVDGVAVIGYHGDVFFCKQLWCQMLGIHLSNL